MRPIGVRGFTLLELLVAIGVFGIASAIAYAALGQAIAVRERLDAEREFWQSVAAAFSRMEDDFSQARGRAIRDADGTPLGAFVGRLVDSRPAALPAVELTRAVPLPGDAAARGDLQRVGYRLEGARLLRLAWPALDRAPRSQPFAATLLPDVEQLRLRYLSAEGGWSDAWEAQDGASLPRGVEITLTLRGRGEFSRVFVVRG